MTPLELLLLAACAALAGLAFALQRRLRRERSAHLRSDEARLRRLLEQAAAEERNRIFDDLHDDLGAKLLQWVYEAESPAQADRARALLQDLRDVVTRSRGATGTLLDSLADIRREAQQRLGAAGIALRWEQADDLPDVALPPERALHLYRIVREAISNAIRHARARALRVRVALGGDRLRLELTDDGQFDAASGEGSGRRSMQARAARLEGDIAWVTGTEGGTKVLLEARLDAGATA